MPRRWLPLTAQQEFRISFRAALNLSFDVSELTVTARRTAQNKRFIMRQGARICKSNPGVAPRQPLRMKD
jgi:hypothetical protein